MTNRCCAKRTSPPIPLSADGHWSNLRALCRSLFYPSEVAGHADFILLRLLALSPVHLMRSYFFFRHVFFAFCFQFYLSFATTPPCSLLRRMSLAFAHRIHFSCVPYARTVVDVVSCALIAQKGTQL